jgi:hypothetical protein
MGVFQESFFASMQLYNVVLLTKKLKTVRDTERWWRVGGGGG